MQTTDRRHAAILLAASALIPSTLFTSHVGAQTMSNKPLLNRRIAILATDGFERIELVGVREALDAAGATTQVIAPQTKFVTGTQKVIRSLEFPNWGADLPVDRWLSEVEAVHYDGMYLPGGIVNPDLLRLDAGAIAFIRSFVATGRPVASMCHGPWLLISVGAVRGRRMTAWPSLKDDLVNAGATYIDEPVVRDGQFITARNPEDIPRFNTALIAHFAAASARVAMA